MREANQIDLTGQLTIAIQLLPNISRSEVTD